MDISFENKSLRQLCENKNKAKTELGEELALKLKTLLADLEVWGNVSDFLAFGFYKFKVKENNHILVTLAEEVSFTFCAINLNIPFLKDNTIDWSKITRIKIVGIEGKNNER